LKAPASIYQTALYTILLCLLFLPLFEITTGFIKVKKLDGAYENKDTLPTFSVKNWLNGTYQFQKEKTVNDSFGFRNIYVRINNQVDYSLFNLPHANEIVGGQDGYLFETHYIDGYYGNDFLGTVSINRTIEKLKFINDTLAKLNKTLLLVITPSKALFYPEYLPDDPYTLRDSTNYYTYLRLLDKSPLHYIDFNNYFIANKYTSKYPLEPKNGIHWSMYGAAIAGDSLIKYIETVRHIHMPKAIWKNTIVRSDTGYDNDVETTMNLLFNLKSPLMAYPNIEFENDITKTKPNVMTVGDSYYWQLLSSYNIGHCFSPDSKFWYYFFKPDHSRLSRSEVKDEINKNDLIMILATAHNYINLGWGFIDTAYCMFKGTYPNHIKSTIPSERLAEIKEGIKTDNEWLQQIEISAKERGISLDSAININALWMIGQENNRKN